MNPNSNRPSSMLPSPAVPVPSAVHVLPLRDYRASPAVAHEEGLRFPLQWTDG